MRFDINALIGSESDNAPRVSKAMKGENATK